MISFRTALLLAFAIPAVVAHGQTRTSADYAFITETLDMGGGTGASADYSHMGTFTSPADISQQAAVSLTMKSGFIGQLYEPLGLQLAALPMAEAAIQQLGASLVLDDTTTLSLAPATLAWSVIGGPLAIGAGGVATASHVFQDTPATIGGSHGGFASTASFTVLNIGNDDYLSYAADGISDAWQVLHFGEENPNAAPDADPDQDGQNNLFEFLAGYAPTDSTSLLSIHVRRLGVGVLDLVLSRVQPGTRYGFETSTNLEKWEEVDSLIPVQVSEPFVRQLPAGGPWGFYRVHLTKP